MEQISNKNPINILLGKVIHGRGIGKFYICCILHRILPIRKNRFMKLSGMNRQTVAAMRWKRIRDYSAGHDFIKTVIGFGYKFNAAYIRCVSLHFFMSFKIGMKLFPRSVREYSTFGGTS